MSPRFEITLNQFTCKISNQINAANERSDRAILTRKTTLFDPCICTSREWGGERMPGISKQGFTLLQGLLVYSFYACFTRSGLSEIKFLSEARQRLTCKDVDFKSIPTITCEKCTIDI